MEPLLHDIIQLVEKELPELPPLTHCARNAIRFSNRRGRKVEADFTGGAITGNGGVMLVSEQDRRLGPSARIARLIDDPRRQASCRHSALKSYNRKWCMAASTQAARD